MTAYPAWTPAPRPGIVPLHPFGFGTTLGRSFTALRQNPGVLLGFALCVQATAYVVVLGVVGVVAFASFSRLDTLVPGSEDFEAVVAGSIALTAVTGLVLTIAAGVLTVLVQGVVVSEVASAVVAEKLRLAQVWRRVRPAAWRLIGYAFLVSGAVVLLVVVVGGALVALGFAALPLAIGLGVLAILAAIPLALWLSTKLFLVPAALILEGAGIGRAIARSWMLTRRRFWPTLGVLVIISVTFGALAQLVGLPLQFVAMGAGTIINPTGEPQAAAIIGVLVTAILTQIVTLLVQCVALIVQSTAAALVYVDCRMRHEGLDLDLQEYVERRDAGERDLPDPYRAHIGRVITPRPAYPYGPGAGYPPPAAAYPPPGAAYPAPAAYPPAGAAYPAPGGTYPPPGAVAGAAAPPWMPPPGGPQPGPGSSPQPGATTPPASSSGGSPTSWAAPGSDASEPR